MRPFYRQARGQLAHRRLGGVVGRLRLRHVHDSPTHGSHHDHAALRLAPDEMAADGRGPQVRAVDVDAPQLPHAVRGVLDGVEVLGEPGRGDQMVYPAVLAQNLVQGRVDGAGVCDVRVMCGDLRNTEVVSIPIGRVGEGELGGGRWSWTYFFESGFSSRKCCTTAVACFSPSSS